MKNLFIIMLLSVVLLPIIWNGMGFFHYLVDHTHTFCENEDNHEHTSTDECLAMCHLGQSQAQHQIPTQIEFYELKQFITTPSILNIRPLVNNLSNTAIIRSHHFGRVYSNDIFHPPIC